MMKVLANVSLACFMLASVAAVALSPLAYMPFMAVLLLVNAFFIFMPPAAGLRLTLMFLTMLLIPCALHSNIGALPAAAVIVPAVPCLDGAIRRHAASRTPGGSTARRRPTSTALALGAAVLLAMLASAALKERALTYAGAVLTAYLIAIVIFVLWRSRAAVISASPVRLRIVAGDTITSDVSLNVSGRLPLLVSLSSVFEWIQLKPSGTRLIGKTAAYNVRITPPLSGPAYPPLQALVTDPWGLIAWSRVVKPLDLFVIPRAAYAAWLARQFLERQSAGAAAASSVLSIPERYRGAIKGVEYQESRPYQPGDRMKDIDWKHSIKFHELITKEYLEGSERTAVLLANLDVADAEQADILAYDLITSALTMAIERIPTALSLYNHGGVVRAAAAGNPRHVLIKAMDLAHSIAVYQPVRKYLEAPDVPRLKRLTSLLKNVDSAPARKLENILRAEYGSLRQAAAVHPAAAALKETSRYVAPPAVIAIISLSSDDTEAIAVTLSDLKQRGYDYFYIEGR